MRRHAIVLTGVAGLVLAAITSATPVKAYEGLFFTEQYNTYFQRHGTNRGAVVAAVQPASAAAAPVPTAPPPAVDPTAGNGQVSYGQPSYGQPGPETRPLASAIPREVVAYNGTYGPGTIVISTDEKRLYYVLPDHQAVKYGVGVGRPGFEWSGTKKVVAKKEWPDWTPPPEMIKRRPDLPRHMAGGIANPLGARAMYLGGTMYRIHGSNEPDSIGQAVSSGCIRMTNDDVVDLYERVKIGTVAVVQR